MSTIPIVSLAGTFLDSLLGGNTTNKNTNSASSANSFPAALDNNQLSPFAQVVSTLQQLEQTNPSQYAQVTQQIAANLQTAAQTAQSQGNTTQANQLTVLANDFTNASTSGQLPNLQDLAQTIGGHHHHHRGGADQLLSAIQNSGSQNDSTNPLSIIQSTLSSAGTTTSNS